MENKKIFIGNLNYEVTEGDVKTLLSKYGTVESIKMHKKKGYAFIGMGNAAEAAQAVKELDGVIYREREIRISPEMKSKKAKLISVRQYKEREARFPKKRSQRDQNVRPQKNNDINPFEYQSKDRERNRNPRTSFGKTKNTYRSNDGYDEQKNDHRRSTKFRADFRSGEQSGSKDGRGGYSSKEKYGSSRSSNNKWSGKRSSGPSGNSNGSWKERTGGQEISEKNNRDYSRPRSESGVQNRTGQSSRPKPGSSDSKSSSNFSKFKSRGNAGKRGRNNRNKGD